MTGMTPLARTLARFQVIGSERMADLDAIPQPERRFAPGDVIIEEGKAPTAAHLLVSGIACCQRDLADGGRQISDFVIAGDMCGLHAGLGPPMDHSVVAVTPVRAVSVANKAMLGLWAHPPTAMGLCRMWHREAVRLREQVVTLGRRNARGRVAHLLCQMHWRYGDAGLDTAPCLQLQLTQTRVADALGLTAVHVGRVLRQFRRDKLIRIERGALILQRIDALRDISEFTDDHLRAPPPPSAHGMSGSHPALDTDSAPGPASFPTAIAGMVSAAAPVTEAAL
ncbi:MULTISPECIES: Crp/Fnr family transcriptional regulator [unclassified Methylobacterium]|uniref:Crp/Fnr family transcriptional regulator n=1 Tax=unclassified Methylobacterium TaxID=2615210 RepID=UPI00226AC55A|nr:MULTISPECIES: Crp/Fnr family transcriptional regulator [unclassified Methylobacterium]